MNDDLYDQLVQAMEEADNSKREAFEESMRRRKAEKEAMEAIRKVTTIQDSEKTFMLFLDAFSIGLRLLALPLSSKKAFFVASHHS